TLRTVPGDHAGPPDRRSPPYQVGRPCSDTRGSARIELSRAGRPARDGVAGARLPTAEAAHRPPDGLPSFEVEEVAGVDEVAAGTRDPTAPGSTTPTVID